MQRAYFNAMQRWQQVLHEEALAAAPRAAQPPAPPPGTDAPDGATEAQEAVS